MSWRRIAILLATSVAVLAGSLAAASASSSSKAPGKAAAPRGGDVTTIQFWNGFTGPDRPALEAVVKAFNASHQDMKVEMTVMPWDVFYQKLLPSFAAGKGPDIVGMASEQMPQYAERGVFQPLDDLYKQGLQKNKLVPSAVEAGKWEGKYYAIPMNFTTLLLYWNKDMFKAAGLNPNKPPTTWKQMAQYAQKLTIDKNKDGKPEQYGFAIADHATIPMWPILIWSFGGDIVSPDGKKPMINSPATVRAVEFWSDLIVNKKISPVGLTGADADQLFQSKKAAMEIVGPWMTTGFKKAGIDFGLAMVPKGPKRQVTLGTSVVYGLSAKADEDAKKAAYEWFKFWHSKKSQITWAVGSGFPPTRTDISARELSKNPYVASFGKYSRQSQFFLAGVKNFTQVNANVFEPAIQKILNKKGSPKKVLDQAAKQMAPLLR